MGKKHCERSQPHSLRQQQENKLPATVAGLARVLAKLKCCTVLPLQLRVDYFAAAANICCYGNHALALKRCSTRSLMIAICFLVFVLMLFSIQSSSTGASGFMWNSCTQRMSVPFSASL